MLAALFLAGFSHSAFPAVTVIPTTSLVVLQGHTSPVTRVAWLPDGKLLSGDWGANLAVWSVGSKKQTNTFKAGLNFVRSLGVFDQGKRYFSCVNDAVFIGRLPTGQAAQNFHNTGGQSNSFAADVSPDGKTVAVQVAQVAVKFISIANGNELGVSQLPVGASLACIAYSPSGQFIVGGGTGSSVCWVFDPGKTTPAYTLPCLPINNIATSPDGLMFAGTNDDIENTAVVGMIKAKSVYKQLASTGGRLEAVAWAPDSSRVATAGTSGLVEFWDPKTGNLKETLQLALGQATSLAFSPDGKWLAIGSGHYLDMKQSPPRQFTRDNAIRLLPVKYTPSKKSGVLATVGSGAAKDVAARLQTLQQQFEAAKTRTLGAEHAQRLKDAKAKYIAELDKRTADAAKTMRLEEGLAFKKEKEAMLSSDPLTPLPFDAPPALESVRAGYEQQLATFQQAERTALQPLYAVYETALTNYLAELSKAQRLEDALIVQEIRDSISASRK
ncbi:hypothetical protein [Prosthecobacter sp.]|uniref:hypothetical protein n=1 Tax=Prosthecobacter sp. TaxID=1965333 RepID=UPI003784801C